MYMMYDLDDWTVLTHNADLNVDIQVSKLAAARLVHVAQSDV